MQQCGEELRAGRADRVAEGDGSAVDVDPLGIRAGFVKPGQDDAGESFVHLEQVDVLNGQSGPAKRVRRRGDRPGEHPHRIRRPHRQMMDPGQRRQAVGPHERLRSDQRGACAVGDLARHRRGDP